MTLQVPESMEECLYFTNRYIGEKGHVLAWVYRKKCPKCGKAKMGKPIVKGKIKTRADYYECPECKYQEKKPEHEESLNLEAQYTCPECGKEGEGTTEYKRKKYKGVLSYIIICEHCSAEIPITKKLKDLKKK
jgi:ssDNA-binding Zn-finger/Zn-ribbon topoisomerase 1